MTPVQIGFLIVWIIVFAVWLVYTYLNYGQVKPLLGLRPRVKGLFIFQLLISLICFGVALGAVFFFPPYYSSFI